MVGRAILSILGVLLIEATLIDATDLHNDAKRNKNVREFLSLTRWWSFWRILDFWFYKQ